MDRYGIGQPVRRKEDVRLLTGAGTYTDDISVAGEAHAHVLRSPHWTSTAGAAEFIAACSDCIGNCQDIPLEAGRVAST